LHEEEALGKAYDAQLLARLWRYVAPYRTQVLLTLVLVAPIFLLGELSPPWIIKTGLDRLFGSEALLPSRGGPEWVASILEPPSWIAPLAWLALLYLMAVLAGTFLQYAHLLLMVVTGQSAMRDLRKDLFAHIQRLHLGFFDRYPVGRLVTRASNDVEHISEMFSSGIVALITDVLKMLGYATVLFWLNARLALVAFLVVPFLAVIAITFRLKIRAAFRAVRVRIARINAMLQETVTGMKIVQLFTQEERHRRDFAALNGAHRDAWLHSIRYEASLFAVVEVAGGISVAIIIAYGTGIASSGDLYFFIDLMRRFFQPLRDLSAKFSVMQSAMASSERIFQLLDTPPAVVDQPEAVRLGPSSPRSGSRGAVEFQNVWFAYRGEDWVLRDVSFRVEPGERIALVGSTGAGKTSVIKLLTRLYEVNRGRILLDGVDLRELPQRDLRRRIAMVLQEVFLFSGSVADNVSLGRPEVDAVAIERAARAVEAHRFIERLPRGYRTVLRERGGDVSTGQRQLLSFARALAHGADVLVLDEATSSVDPETEEIVQRGIHTLMQGKTALVIAHRLSTIQDVDRIYVLHRGRVVETGRHEELLAADGIYRRLYRLQFQGAREWSGARAAG
jgi:ABC-type multidrug transport system fused ATPase/permease subunit